jgi:hypothetical protein
MDKVPSSDHTNCSGEGQTAPWRLLPAEIASRQRKGTESWRFSFFGNFYSHTMPYKISISNKNRMPLQSFLMDPKIIISAPDASRSISDCLISIGIRTVRDLNWLIFPLNHALKFHQDSIGESGSSVWVSIRPIGFVFEHSSFASALVNELPHDHANPREGQAKLDCFQKLDILNAFEHIILFPDVWEALLRTWKCLFHCHCDIPLRF